jgi:diguanylate cyclase (GGDEF)-like protein/PAS domain S-box-containing protein
MITQVLSHHDIRLVILAALVCAGGSLATFTIYAHLLARPGTDRAVWVSLTGFCAGAGIWATHFVAMLAYKSGLPTTYDLFLTVLSFCVAVGVTMLGIAISLRPGREMIVAGGAIIGLGIAAMHFIGMQALTVPGTLEWNETLAGLAILLGVVFPSAAMLAHRRQSGLRAVLSGASLFALGILALHFTAMAAVTIVARQAAVKPALNVLEPILALAIAVVTALILLTGYAVAFLDGRAMRESLTRTGELVEAAIEGLVIANNGAIVNINSRALELCGRKAQALLGKRVFGDLLAPTRRPAASHLFEVSLLRADGTTIPVEVVRRPLNGLSHGNEVYAIRDLREREEATRQLAKANQELRRREEELRTRNIMLDNALGNMSQGLCMYDKNQQVVICNERFATIYGLPADAVQPGMHLREVVQKRIDNGLYAGASAAAYMEDRLAPVLRPEDSIHELNNGQIIAIARRPMPGGGWLTTHADITHQRKIEAQITHLADHDALTSLLSRTALRDRLEGDLRGAGKRNRRHAVLVLGIDRFSEINDTMGHAVGDKLLKAVAQRLQDITRGATILGRLGDDTFVIVEVVEHPGKDAIGLANRVQSEIGKPFMLGDVTLEITATIGIALSPADGTDADALLQNAALALNRGKIEARGSHHFFEPAMDRKLRARRALERELTEAYEKRQLQVQYQPLVNLARNDVTGFEAVLRWRHPERGWVEAESFLPLAEETGLVTAIGKWMLLEACSEAVHWPRNINVAVGLSAALYRSADFVPLVVRTLASTGLSAERLQIEISEKAIHNHTDQVTPILKELSKLGVLITLNDFGSGFASLNYLRQFRVHKIKIDRSFLSELTMGGDSQVIIRMLARMGAGLGMVTTIEGVETKEQLDMVRAEGCTEIQGRYFSPPKTAEEIRELYRPKPKDNTARSMPGGFRQQGSRL